jgi:ABC-type antimicrobial peptide transport system permease subunit
MMHATPALPQRSAQRLIPSVVTLACWRARQTWRLLLLIGMALLAGVILLCSVPLLSQVALTAGLRNTLTVAPVDSELVLSSQATLISTQVFASDKQQLNSFLRARLGSYVKQGSQFHIDTPRWKISSPDIGVGSFIGLMGADFPQATPHVKVLQGRLPAPSASQLEIAITPISALSLKLAVGSTITVSLDIVPVTADGTGLPPIALFLPLQVVGMIAPTGADYYWHGEDFNPVPDGGGALYPGLMSNDTFLNVMTQIAAAHGGTALMLGNDFDARYFNPTFIEWYFSLDATQVNVTNLGDLLARLNTAQVKMNEQYGNTPALSDTKVNGTVYPSNGVPSPLTRFFNRSKVVQIPVFLLAAQALALILLFVSLLATILVERQETVIALLRSRGASRRQILGAFAVQSLALGLLAALAGPPLALLAAWLIGHLTLTPSNQNALTFLTANPLQAALGGAWLALITAAGMVAALLFSIWGATRRDVLTIRREAARSKRRPLWQRLQLDLVAALMALAVYASSLYLTRSGAIDASTNQIIALPLSLVGPLFLLVAALLLFLRLFPHLLRFFAWRAARRPGAPPLLALAQMSRAPQQPLRVILLLSLAAAFACFTLVFQATEAQQIRSAAAQQAGADFSGALPRPPNVTPTPAQWEALYRKLSGVTAVSAGTAVDTVSAGQATTIPIEIRAVDTSTFAQTATWTSEDASQPLASLLAQISSPDAFRQAPNAVPAIVDAVAWKALQLSPGAQFNVAMQGLPNGVAFVAIAEVQHIPTVNDSLETSGTNQYTTPGGIIVDYERLAQVYGTLVGVPGALAANYLWLRTSSDQKTLAKVRAALGAGQFQLENVLDRRALIDLMQQDPLYVAITGILLLGVSITLLLALVGALLVFWLSTSARLTNFAVLRALGGAPRQIASVLRWEQGLICGAALVLGSLFGALLVLSVVPGLVFTNPAPPGSVISDAEFAVMQHVLPVQIVLPPSLGGLLAVFIALCALVLLLMARAASAPRLSQTLRLNED